MNRRRWGWGVAVTLLAAAGVVGTMATVTLPEAVRGPSAHPNPNATAPQVEATKGVAHVQTTNPDSLLVLYTRPPNRHVQVLWLDGRATSPDEDRVALDASGSPLRFGDGPIPRRLLWHLEGREPTSVASAGDGRYWVTTRSGDLLAVDAVGRITDSLRSPHAYAWVAATPGGVWAYRSPEQFSFPFGQPLGPLVTAIVGPEAPPTPARNPMNPLMADLVNAGRVVPADDGGFFYAPFIRDEILRFAPNGDTVWLATRGLEHGVAEPSIGLGANGQAELDYAPVNLGLQVGPDGMVYVLSTPGRTVERARLDRVDPLSGVVRATVELPTALPTVAVDPQGHVFLLEAMQLLTGVEPAERASFRSFDLASLDGNGLRSDDFAGRVLLVNFWASWCAPCREEMPALDALRSEFPAERFGFVAISEDVQERNARAFIEEFDFGFPVALGRGRMRSRYHYFGLPHTVLVDANGKIIYQWSGYGGSAHMEELRGVIRAELERTHAPDTATSTTDPAHHH